VERSEVALDLGGVGSGRQHLRQRAGRAATKGRFDAAQIVRNAHEHVRPGRVVLCRLLDRNEDILEAPHRLPKSRTGREPPIEQVFDVAPNMSH